MTELPAGAAWALYAWVALVGACLGSFLNVVVARLPAGESVVRPRSRCPRCRTPIAWFDNLPVLAWILLRGRCRTCRAPISPRYPLVEAAVAAIAVWVVVRNGPSPAAVLELAFAALLVALALIDVDTWLLPHALTWPVIALGLVAAALGAGPAPSLASSAGGAVAGFVAFAAISIGAERLLHKEALGFGDVWLLAGIGAFLGAGALLPVVLLASTQGALVGIALLLLGRGQPGPTTTATAATNAAATATANTNTTETASTTATGIGTGTATEGEAAQDEEWVPPRHAVPFGPFLVAGALEWLWLGDLLARGVPALELFR